jgi:hypothetical protein
MRFTVRCWPSSATAKSSSRPLASRSSGGTSIVLQGNEPHRRRGAVGIDLVIAGLDPLHLFFADLGVVQRRGPVRAPLEDGELLRLLGDLGDGLNGGRSGADDADAFASEVHRRVRPRAG